MPRIILMLMFLAPLGGCYYMQAAAGQWEILRKREPVDEVIADPETAPRLAERLQLLHEARDFSVAELGLPDNNSYRTYTELEREYVLWNVFAAPEFSLEARQWCFPVAGCVSYRGYFAKQDAIDAAQKLQSDGMDVALGGVSAYSTLGRFSDPILSTMMAWEDVNLVAVLFHELAHQVVYVKNDTAFNESFATAVEEFGVQRWLESRGQSEQMAEYLAARELQQTLMAYVSVAREDLAQIYSGGLAANEMRTAKKLRLQQLSDQVNVELRSRGRDDANWLTGELNNARLISTMLYEGQLPVFREMIERCDDDIRCFYREAKRLASLSEEERGMILSRTSGPRVGRLSVEP